ncbi:MAG: hypothetical protein RML35_09515 [Chloroherpetonaceae bacterium]|nr:hypothetical protein [Chloroherpetonaceae bacterium]
MKTRYTVLCWLALSLVASAQSSLSPSTSLPWLIFDAKAGVGGMIPPDFSRWSETVRLIRSPDVRTSLDAGMSALFRLADPFYGGVDVTYVFFEDAADATSAVQQLRLTGTMLIPSVCLSIVPLAPLQSRALVKLTVGTGLLLGTINNTLSQPSLYRTTGLALFSEFTFGLPLSASVLATFNASLRGGLTGVAQNGSERLEYLNSDREKKPVTLSFFAFSLRFGIALKLPS